MNTIEQLRRNNQRYSETFDKPDLPMPPSRRVAIVACMDARLNVYGLLGLQVGEAHVIRNAGGVVTDDVLRSLLISQRLLGTREIMLIHHTDCGMLTFRDEEVKNDVYREARIRPPFALEAFDDPCEDVRQSIARIESSPFIRYKDRIRGFVFDVNTGGLVEVQPEEAAAGA